MEEEVRQWLDDVTFEDVPADSQRIAKAIGLEAFLKLIHITGGITRYIPKFDAVIQPARDRRIINEFNGSNYRELAIKYNLSDTWVRQLIQQHLEKRDQCKLFNEAV